MKLTVKSGDTGTLMNAELTNVQKLRIEDGRIYVTKLEEDGSPREVGLGAIFRMDSLVAEREELKT